MDFSIQQIAKLAGTTSRTLRHYGSIGLLEPTRTGHNGYRYYDRDALVRLQRILLLRQLGLGLDDIAEVLAHDGDPILALRRHLEWLGAERERLDRQERAVRQTIKALETGGPLMATDMFDGFDHTQYKDEVEQRWGTKAYADSDAWWRGLGAEGQKEWQARVAQLSADWQAAFASGEPHDGAAAQALAGRHVQWLASIPGTPGYPEGPAKEYVLGLADMCVADERFAKNYGGTEGAAFVRDSLHAYADREL
ncbi:TipAS antibiotic-recognition domain-containing protein [Sinomonas notoginsengisoli]|uniref:MerR family transcriptional regulator n=1 Tax=Sinomonas notoginsengisoli TaxID=1457311 RepID=UPI001F3B5980|nr:MerR family transcriptional regulator [Sinomonas notoginsengisoli]